MHAKALPRPPGTLPVEHVTTDDGGTLMTETLRTLPDSDEAPLRGAWNIQPQSGSMVRLEGRFLGMGTTHRPEHKNHPAKPFAPQGVHCSTCRWTEIRLFADNEGSFWVVSVGASEVPGERDLIRLTRCSTADEVIETLAVFDRRLGKTVLAPHARRALARSASYSASLREAYRNSPVTR